MDIAATSAGLAQYDVLVQASYSVAKKAMDVTETQVQNLLDMMPKVPSFGHRLDIRA